MDGEGEEGEGEISPMCESIGHRPLRGRCPKKGKDSKTESKIDMTDNRFTSTMWKRNADGAQHLHVQRVNNFKIVKDSLLFKKSLPYSSGGAQ